MKISGKATKLLSVLGGVHVFDILSRKDSFAVCIYIHIEAYTHIQIVVDACKCAYTNVPIREAVVGTQAPAVSRSRTLFALRLAEWPVVATPANLGFSGPPNAVKKRVLLQSIRL